MSQRHLVGALLAAMAFVLILLGDHTVVSTADQTQGGFRGSGNQKWVGTWATSPQATSDIRFANQTLRMIMRTSLGGNKVRVRFSNAYGAGASRDRRGPHVLVPPQRRSADAHQVGPAVAIQISRHAGTQLVVESRGAQAYGTVGPR
jgi:hypothetical protein